MSKRFKMVLLCTKNVRRRLKTNLSRTDVLVNCGTNDQIGNGLCWVTAEDGCVTSCSYHGLNKMIVIMMMMTKIIVMM